MQQMTIELILLYYILKKAPGNLRKATRCFMKQYIIGTLVFFEFC